MTSIRVYVDDRSAHVDLGLAALSLIPTFESRESAVRVMNTAKMAPQAQMQLFMRIKLDSPSTIAHWIVDIREGDVVRHGRIALDPLDSRTQGGEIPVYLQQYEGARAKHYVIVGDTVSLGRTVAPASGLIGGQVGLSDIGVVDIPFFDDKSEAGYAARLPQVETIPSTALGEIVQMLAVGAPGALAPTALIEAPYTASSHSTSGTPLPDNVPTQLTKTRYYFPASQHTTELLVGGSRIFSGSQTTTLTPVNPQFASAGIEWESDGSISPVVQTSDIAYSRQESTNEFYAGLAFATAAATLVAAVQEVRIRRPRREKGWEPDSRSYL